MLKIPKDYSADYITRFEYGDQYFDVEVDECNFIGLIIDLQIFRRLYLDSEQKFSLKYKNHIYKEF